MNTFQAGAVTADINLNDHPAVAAMSRVINGMHEMAGQFKETLGEGLSSVFEGVGVGIGEKLFEHVEELPAKLMEMLVEKIQAAMENIEAVGQSANALGIATEKLTELDYAARQARVSNEELALSLKMMSNNIADAANGAGTAGDSLRAMGLRAMDLANLHPDEAFARVADGLKAIENGSQRTQAAMNIFGRQAGPQLLEMMSEGSEGMEKAAQRARALGITFNDVDAAKVMQANAALKDIGEATMGMVQQAAIALAPYIEGIAREFTDAGIAGGGFGHYAVDAVEWVAKGVAGAADNLALYEAEWYTLKAGVIAAVGGIIQAVELMEEGLAKVLALIPGMGDAAASVGEAAAELQAGADSMASDAVDAWDKAGDKMDAFASGENSAKVSAFFDGIKKSSNDAAAETAKNMERMRGGGFVSTEGPKALADLDKQIAQSGMNDFQKKFDDMARTWGAADPLGLKTAGDRLDQLEAIATKESIMNPGDKFHKAMDRLDKLHDEGKLTDFDFRRAEGKAANDAFGESKLPGIMKAGSAEALAARYDASRPNPNDPLAVQRAQLAAVLEGNKQLETIASALGNITMADPVQV